MKCYRNIAFFFEKFNYFEVILTFTGNKYIEGKKITFLERRQNHGTKRCSVC